jgi:transposase
VQCKSCGTVKRERLDFLADKTFSTKRLAPDVGKRGRATTSKEIAEELPLDWDTGKALEKQYRAAQGAKRGTPGPKGSGIDEIAIRTGPTSRIGGSDRIRRQALWFGGEERWEASMAQFYGWLGKRKAAGMRLAGMDMGKPFRNAPTPSAPQAAILFDKFHLRWPLGEALDEVRKAEYRRLSGKDRRSRKGQKYTLLSPRENLTSAARQSLKVLLAAHKRLNTASLLTESFGQL